MKVYHISIKDDTLFFGIHPIAKRPEDIEAYLKHLLYTLKRAEKEKVPWFTPHFLMHVDSLGLRYTSREGTLLYRKYGNGSTLRTREIRRWKRELRKALMLEEGEEKT